MLHCHRLSIGIPASTLPETEAALYALGALSLSLKDAADQPLLEPAPGETPLWDHLVIEALFDADIPQDSLLKQLMQHLPGLQPDQIHCSIVEDQAWERVWMDRFKPMRFGRRLWIYPSHHQPPADDRVAVLLDPGLAFGSGTHATTAMCLQWLDAQNLKGKTILDYGCGSGVLAIAALRLGAAGAYALDIDEQALTATQANAALNGVSDRIKIDQAGSRTIVEADIVLANIISSVLLSLRQTLTSATSGGGRLIISGILPDQAPEIRRAYGNDFDVTGELQQQDWVLLELEKKRR